MEFRVRHLGGERCVTGSCRLVQIRGQNILVDCGMVQGHDASVPIEKWPVKPVDVDFVFLTHAHVDHTGLLPTLIQQGFKGQIISSHPTAALILPMLKDAMRFETLGVSEREKITACPTAARFSSLPFPSAAPRRSSTSWTGYLRMRNIKAGFLGWHPAPVRLFLSIRRWDWRLPGSSRA